MDREADINREGTIDIDDLHWDYSQGDGDSDMKKSIRFRDQVDMVITNPPFSLFRELMAWL
ncbi:MAG: adenine-specific methyltransferase EcoRI family protein [Lawsonella sp.]|uniref:adenine-specific methyltransferase EcoRI family protein n=1 Tax=Lawsonella sp. TaxID=2041415 RepID=UPI002A76603C|nr:adenine-specific methyltransferase EcoRI family protein [Lawsonella sp.]MDY2979896.1 adenine-specific methyltransferase EcoRI family protein [Lawsonella sp.]